MPIFYLNFLQYVYLHTVSMCFDADAQIGGNLKVKYEDHLA